MPREQRPRAKRRPNGWRNLLLQQQQAASNANGKQTKRETAKAVKPKAAKACAIDGVSAMDDGADEYSNCGASMQLEADPLLSQQQPQQLTQLRVLSRRQQQVISARPRRALIRR